MPSAAIGANRERERRLNHTVLISAVLFVIGAAIVYAEKAAEDRSAFIRWRHQVLQLMDGVNIYDTVMYPNPPIMPLTLYPLMLLPPVVGALCWYGLKVGLTAMTVRLCFGMVRPGDRALPAWVKAAILILSVRPILSDLHHGNNNLVILFLVVASLEAWRKGYDVLAGLILALSISYKVTPALFGAYFLYKRSWRTVVATGLGMGLFLLVVPSLVLGVEFNAQCLAMWWHRMLSPYLTRGEIGDHDINQSMVGVLSRLLTEGPVGDGRHDRRVALNFVSWDPGMVDILLKALSLGMVGLLALFCRTRTDRRDDPRLLGEFSLVVLTMLFVSERSWKHHFVTLLLPYTYLMYRVGGGEPSRRVRRVITAGVVLSFLLIASTSSELGGLFADGKGHKIAQGYGLYLAAGLVLYVLTAWRVCVEGGRPPVEAGAGGDAEGPTPSLPVPHFAESRRRGVES